MPEEDTLPIDDEVEDEVDVDLLGDEELDDEELDEEEEEDEEGETALEEETSLEEMADAELADSAAADPDEEDESTGTFLPADSIDLDGLDEIEEATAPAGDTFVCSECFLAKPRVQLADRGQMICVDCAE